MKKLLSRRKRLLSWVLVLLACVLVSCGSGLQDELLSYINEDLAAVSALEDEMYASFESVSGDNFTNDAAMYAEIADVTLPLANRMREMVMSIVPVSEELQSVHAILADYADTYVEAYGSVLAALESQEEADVERANGLIEEANALAAAYYDALSALAAEHDVELVE